MKTLFICKHNLGRSQMAQAFYNRSTKTNDAISAGTMASVYAEKTMGEFSEETRTMKVLREINLDITNAPRQQLTPKLARDVSRIISFLPCSELPQWLQNDTRVRVWHIKNYPAPDIATLRRQRDEIIKKVDMLPF
jgi:protein-tyrosine-phosphatase